MLSSYRVTQADIVVEFETESGQKRDPFRLTWPNRCNLGHEGIDLHLQSMLVRSGLVYEPPTLFGGARDDAR